MPSTDLLSSKADFLRSMSRVLNEVVEFDVDDTGSPRIEDLSSSGVKHSVLLQCGQIHFEVFMFYRT